MLVVSAEFQIQEKSRDAFTDLLLENARAAMETEPGCRQFDVSISRRNPDIVFVYELYDDKECFKSHAASTHYQRFDEATKEMITNRSISVWERVFP